MARKEDGEAREVKVFTLEEAMAILPWLRQQLGEMERTMALQQRRQAELQELRRLLKSNGVASHEDEVDEQRRELEGLEEKVAQTIQRVRERDIILRDPQQGLVDFPAIREGREVYLCWLKGEDRIGFWHDVDTGYSGRRPL